MPANSQEEARMGKWEVKQSDLSLVDPGGVQDVAYLPLFERLEAEQAALQSQSAALERAKQHLIKTRPAPASAL